MWGKNRKKYTFLLSVEFITKYLSSLLLKKTQLWNTTIHKSSDKYKHPKTETNETKAPKQWNNWVKKNNVIDYILPSLCFQLNTSVTVYRVNRPLNSQESIWQLNYLIERTIWPLLSIFQLWKFVFIKCEKLRLLPTYHL